MKEFSQEAEQVMIERFGKDTIISLGLIVKSSWTLE